MGDLYDAPNQQAVRPDGSGPWEEGTGGSEPAQPQPTSRAAKKDDDEDDKPAKQRRSRETS